MEGVFLGVNSLVSDTVVDSFGLLAVILKTLGIVVIVYIIYFIIKTIFDIKRNRRIKFIESKIISVEHKLDALLKNQKVNVMSKKSLKKKHSKK